MEFEIGIIQRASSDKFAFDAVMKHYSPYVYRLCKRLCKISYDSDELFQETWIKVYKNIHSFNIQKKFSTWLYTICLNTYKDNYNKNKKLLSKVKDLFSDTSEKDKIIVQSAINDISTEEEIIKSEQQIEIQQYINQLKDSYRIPLILYYFKDLAYNDIAEILGIPVGTVKSRLNQAKLLLRKKMEGKEWII